MTLPPHGPPEITEAQQAATSLGEVEDPTPDNVSRALQDYSPYAVAAAAAALGASGGGGGGSLPDPITDPVTIETGADETQLTVTGIGAQDATLIKANLGGTTPGEFVDVWENQATVTVGSYSLTGEAGRATLGADDPTAHLTLSDKTGSSAVSLVADPSGDLAAFSSGGTSRLRVSPSGYLVIQCTSVIPSIELGDGEVALWFDPTDGAGKLMVKAKTANGTVVIGHVSLND